jgi:hypothetical protein
MRRVAHSISEVAQAIGASRGTIYAELRAGRLTGRKLRARTVVTDDDLRAYLDSLPHMRQPRAPAVEARA